MLPLTISLDDVSPEDGISPINSDKTPYRGSFRREISFISLFTSHAGSEYMVDALLEMHGVRMSASLTEIERWCHVSEIAMPTTSNLAITEDVRINLAKIQVRICSLSSELRS